MFNFPRTPGKQHGFTLVELLAAMVILAILAAISMSAFQQVEVQARAERTKAMIQRLDKLIMEKYHGYRTRVVPLKFATTGTTTVTPRQASQARLYAIRELMRMELPDRIADICDDTELTDLGSGDDALNAVNNVSVVKRNNNSLAVPAVTRGYKTKAKQLMAQSGQPWSATYEQAECLYLIVAAIRNDTSSAIDYFTSREIQNVDGDAIPEFIDAWGQPIMFLRWAPGFTADKAITLQTADRLISPDPFDPVHADPRWGDMTSIYPYALKPLIFSGGPDRKLDIAVGLTGSPFIYATTSPPNDPYATNTPLFGAPTDYNGDGLQHIDNLTNHYVEVN